jgi:type VI secretion system protein ImpL
MASLPLWLVITVGVIALAIVVGFFWYLMYGGEEEEDAPRELEGIDPLSVTAADGSLSDTLATTTEELKTTARASRVIRMKESFERSLDSREARATKAVSTKDRMLMPWYLLVGADGSGKKTILANSGLPLPWGPPMEVDSKRKDAGKWWFFDDAVVLEAPAATAGTTVGSTTLPPGQTVADASVGWNTLLHMLRRERPDSPLNGIIVTISCHDLLQARNDPEKMEEQADRINTFLTKTRNFLGVRLPLHVLVTKCDTLPGFKSFAQALPEARRHDIFGWANPADPEARFEAAWIDAGFTKVHDQLTNLRDEVLAAPEHVDDSTGVFVFDTEFADLQDPLKSFVARILTVGERRPTLFFRGFYFTGDAIEEQSKNDVETTLSEAKPRSTMMKMSMEIVGEEHHLVFLRSLFKDKIFKEAGLARPMQRWHLSRDRRVIAAQAAAILIAIGGSLGLWMAVNGFRRADRVIEPGLKAEAQQLTRVLSGVAIDLDEVRSGTSPASPLDRRARDAAVLELVAQMRDVPSMGVRSPFIPSSWFSPLPRDIRQSMMEGLQTIVLPVTRQRLEERAARLLGTGTPLAGSNGSADGTVALSSEDTDAIDPRALAAYLTDVQRLSRNIERYNSLADSTKGSMAELSALLDYLFGEQMANDTGLATSDFEDALRRAKAQRITVPAAVATTVVNRAVAMVAPLADQAAQQLAPRTGTPPRPEDDLRALNALALLVQLTNPREGIVATVGDSVVLGTRVARRVQDSIGGRFARVAARIARDTVAPDTAVTRLRFAIERLYQLRMMRPMEDRTIQSDIKPGERLTWDLGSLEAALSMPGEFSQAVLAITDGFPGQNERLRRALAVQLRTRTIEMAANAQRFTPVPAGIDTSVAEIKAAGVNLDEASKRLARLAPTFDSLNARSEGRMLAAAAARQAEHALARAQRVFDGWTGLKPNADSVARWQGELPFAVKALGVRDSLDVVGMMIQYPIDVKALAEAVGPSIRYLRSATFRDSTRVPHLVARWEAINISAARHARGEATSSLAMLIRYVRDDLTMRDLTTCTTVAAIPDSTKPSSDVFVTRRRQFRAALVSRCGTTGAADAVASYVRLRALFESKLAGRYPFVDSVGRVAGEADPAAVREFFRQYDAFRTLDDISLRSHPTLSVTARAAITFIDQLAAVRSFMAPFTDSGSVRTTPAYSILASMTMPADTLPLNFLDLSIGGRQSILESTPAERYWRFGDSVSVVQSPLDSAGMERTLSGSGGGWALLRFLANLPEGIKVQVFHPDTKLELAVPRFPATAPDIPIQRR